MFIWKISEIFPSQVYIRKSYFPRVNESQVAFKC